ncbi:outer membrane beta-barrel protein [Mucilaginibacter calamicampi]|uniref:Outer membrane beta-barrel protein n=1 Tax=Mucilaginibacter calamicampi TaxID=1302352 RepID=A0ABW2YTX2_9SPHI
MIKKYLVLTGLLLCSRALLAQSVPVWGGGADQKDFSAGFSFSYVSSYYKIDRKPEWRQPYFDASGTKITNELTNITSENAPGFAVGFLGRYRLTDHLEARLTPALIFADRSVTYQYVTPDQDQTKSIRATLVDLPLQLKLKSDRLGDYRAYLIGGLKYSQALGNKENSDVNAAPTAKLLKTINGYGSYEVGVGMDIYFEFFKLSPEIKISNSFGNVLLRENNAFAAPINSLSLHTVMFSLHFE